MAVASAAGLVRAVKSRRAGGCSAYPTPTLHCFTWLQRVARRALASCEVMWDGDHARVVHVLLHRAGAPIMPRPVGAGDSFYHKYLSIDLYLFTINIKMAGICHVHYDKEYWWKPLMTLASCHMFSIGASTFILIWSHARHHKKIIKSRTNRSLLNYPHITLWRNKSRPIIYI